jgi:hypothetical protein
MGVNGLTSDVEYIVSFNIPRGVVTDLQGAIENYQGDFVVRRDELTLDFDMSDLN